MKYSLNDIAVVPSEISLIESRKQCNPYHRDGMLPLFTAPMSSVVDMSNYAIFKENKINPIIPRSIDIETRIAYCSECWTAFSLDEFIELTSNIIIGNNVKLYLLIDIANGHMKKLHDAIKIAKQKYGNSIIIMAGNIANPETYRLLSEAGADYVRIGIGSGSVCITSSNTSIHFPMASLIKECFEISLTLDNPAYIVADGGIKGYADIIKCLALGADYVMCGSIFNKMLESAGVTTIDGYLTPIDQYASDTLNEFKNGTQMYKEHYGMSTRRAQQEINGEAHKTSEGIEKEQKVEYTMPQWTENFVDYLKSAMSYTSSFDLHDDFIGNVKTIIISNNSYNSINK